MEKDLRQSAGVDLQALALQLSEIDASMDYMVGGKSANLGELRNIAGMPTPRGFAVTVRASAIMLLQNGDLFDKIRDCLSQIDAEKPQTLCAAATRAASLIVNAEMPESLRLESLNAWDEAFGADGRRVAAAVRSSAIAEDGVQSFAGQYVSDLNVDREGFPAAIKIVIASLYSERALAYRAAHGYALDASGMGVCCLEMVRAKSAGIAFSRNPVDLRSNSVLINGSWGLGELVVDGACCPDQWEISRDSGKIRRRVITRKEVELVIPDCDPAVGQRGEPLLRSVPDDLKDKPCLTDEQAERIAEMILALEEHYHHPQDAEWAIDENNRLFFLQTRHLGLDEANYGYGGLSCDSLSAMPLLLGGGDIVAKGLVCGPIFRINSGDDPSNFPEGAILLTQDPSPNIMIVLRRAGGVIAKYGGLTGHLASVCREFGIPAVFNLSGAAAILREGQIVMLDALSGRIFDGEFGESKELSNLELSRLRKTAANTPAATLLRRITPYILPLRLSDSPADDFSPAGWLSLHDIAFCERSLAERERADFCYIP